MGLAFDAVDMRGAMERIYHAAQTRSRLLFVTPNVNFVVLAANDNRFRDTVLHSQLSLVDGMPLVWLGKKVGIPFTERVAGSSLLDRLVLSERPLRVYFFGGPPDAARLASERLPSLGPGLVPVGHYTPGFGSIESMSTPELIDSINRSEADFLVVALGAKKGHEWIARNLDRLRTPVISHLGASVNFLAGTIARAPHWMQAAGLEWLWRILQEPALVRRYWDDARHFLPAALSARRATKNPPGPATLTIHPDASQPDASSNAATWRLNGDLTLDTAGTLQAAFEAATAQNAAPAIL
ncbi:MAG: WecB/TagA/CpsF family glycosyltransferase, partial [Steroidobacteraceae bacterium]